MPATPRKTPPRPAAAPVPARVERNPVRLSPRPAVTVVVCDIPHVGRVRLTLEPAALRAARPALDRGDLVGALRDALRSAR